MLFEDKIQEFAKTTFGKITIAVLFAIPLYLTWHETWILAPLAVLGISLLKKNRIHAVLLLGIFAALFFNSLFNFRTYSYPEKEFDLFSLLIKNSTTHSYFAHLISLFGILLIFFSIRLYSKTKRKPAVVLCVGLLLGITICISQFTEPRGIISILSIAVALIIMKCFWYISYSMLSTSSSQQPTLLTYLGSIAPIWSFGFVRIHAVPRGITEIISSSSEDTSQFTKTQLKGLKIAYFAMIYKIIAVIFFHIFYNFPFSLPQSLHLSLPQFDFAYPPFIGFSSYNQMAISLWEKWFFVLFRPGFYILYEMAGNAGLVIAFVNLLGFDIQKSVVKPHLAKNFHDFFNRVYFYYNSLIIQFFFIPIYQVLFKLKIKSKMRIFIGIFLAIIIGGLTITYIRGTSHIIQYGFLNSFYMSIGRSFYLVGLSLFVGLSIIFNDQISKLRITQPIRIFIIYFIYAILNSLQGNLVTDSLSDRFQFLLSLFNIAI